MTNLKTCIGWRRVNDGHYTNSIFTVKKRLTQDGESTFAWKYFLLHATPEEPIISSHNTLDEALNAAATAKPRFVR